MKKLKDSFADNAFDYLEKINYEKINDFIKKNIWITPIIYIVGTIILLLRNKILGLPFAPLSFLQFVLIVIYFSFFILIFSIMEYLYLYLQDIIVNFKLKKIPSILVLIVSTFIFAYAIYFFIWFLTGNGATASNMTISGFIIYPMIQIIVSKSNAVTFFISFVYFSLFIFNIPMQLGGLSGTKVTYYNRDNDFAIDYLYFGNYDGMYQFIKDDKVVLIPIDSGYIEYKR